MVEYNPYIYLWGLGNDAYPFQDLKSLKGVSSVTGAFLIDSNTETDRLNQEWYDSISYIKEYTGKFWLSIGGANGPHYWDKWSVDKFVEIFKKDVLNEVDVYGIDWDIEGPDLYHPKNIKWANEVSKKLKEYKPNLKFSLTIPVASYRSKWDIGGLTSQGLEAVRIFKTDLQSVLDCINLMTMNFGTIPNEMGKATILAIEETEKQLKQIGFRDPIRKMSACPMLGFNDIQNNITKVSDFVEIYEYAKKRNMYDLRSWALNRDNAYSGKYAGLPVNSMLNEKDFEFAHSIGVFPLKNSGVSNLLPEKLPEEPEKLPASLTVEERFNQGFLEMVQSINTNPIPEKLPEEPEKLPEEPEEPEKLPEEPEEPEKLPVIKTPDIEWILGLTEIQKTKCYISFCKKSKVMEIMKFCN